MRLDDLGPTFVFLKLPALPPTPALLFFLLSLSLSRLLM